MLGTVTPSPSSSTIPNSTARRRAPASTGNMAYVAQPKGGPLYGRDGVIYGAKKTLFGAVDPSVTLPASSGWNHVGPDWFSTPSLSCATVNWFTPHVLSLAMS